MSGDVGDVLLLLLFSFLWRLESERGAWRGSGGRIELRREFGWLRNRAVAFVCIERGAGLF